MTTLCVIDPSGNYNSGKGKTGISYVVYDESTNELLWDTLRMDTVSAKNYTTRHDYWAEIMRKANGANELIIESFMIRSEGFLVGTMPETIMLIGALTWELEKLKIPYIFQTPSQAKVRFKNEVLLRKVPNFTQVGDRFYFNGKQTNDHMRDSLRHLLYYTHYGKKKNEDK
jgi:hypothetical protein